MYAGITDVPILKKIMCVGVAATGSRLVKRTVVGNGKVGK